MRLYIQQKSMANTVKALWFEQIANAVIQANLLELRRLFGHINVTDVAQVQDGFAFMFGPFRHPTLIEVL